MCCTVPIPSDDTFYARYLLDATNNFFNNLLIVAYCALCVFFVVGCRNALVYGILRFFELTWKRRRRMRDAFDSCGLWVSVFVNRERVLLDAYYSIRSAGTRLEFVVRVPCHGFHRVVGHCPLG